MTTYVRTVSGIAMAAVLAACAANNANLKPPAEKSTAVATTSVCPPQTGSLITINHVVSSYLVRCYSSDDIWRTGAVTVEHALPILDPTVMVQR